MTSWTAHTAYALLLPALLGWGIGLALLTPAVVAAAMAASPPERTGLGSGVNNTARQIGGALGIAIFGAIAGSPGDATAFLSGLRLSALIAAGLLVLAAGATSVAIPSRRSA